MRKSYVGGIVERNTLKTSPFIGAYVTGATPDENMYTGRLVDTRGEVTFQGPLGVTLEVGQPVLLARPSASGRMANASYVYVGRSPIHSRSWLGAGLDDDYEESVTSSVVTSMPDYVVLVAGGDPVEVVIYGKNLVAPSYETGIEDESAQVVSSTQLTLSVRAPLTTDSGSYDLTIGESTFADFFRVRGERPSLAEFSWVNQGLATATQETPRSPIVMSLAGPLASAPVSFRILEKAVPGSTFTVTMAISASMADVDYQRVGLVIRSAVGSGRSITVGLMTATAAAANGPFLRVEELGSATDDTPTTRYDGAATLAYSSGVIYFRISDDGTTLRFYWSSNGETFTQLYSQTRAAYLGTPTKIGFYVTNEDAIAPREPVSMSVLQFVES